MHLSIETQAIPRTVRAAPLLLAIGGLLALALVEALQHVFAALAPGAAPLDAFEVWSYLGTTALGLAGGFGLTGRRSGFVVLAMALGFLLVFSAASLRLLFEPGYGVAAPACNALAAFALALTALHFALMRLAPAHTPSFH